MSARGVLFAGVAGVVLLANACSDSGGAPSGVGPLDGAVVDGADGGGCSVGQNVCNGSCVASSPQACGPTCQVCAAPKNGSATCESDACGFQCADSSRKCASACCQLPSMLSAGGGHTCIAMNGTVQCWGNNADGQLGDGSTDERHVPVSVAGLPNGVVAVSSGAAHTCALIADGSVYCWGRNDEGELGVQLPNNERQSSSPIRVASLEGVATIRAGGYHTCAITGEGKVVCWGYNQYGQLGMIGDFISTPNKKEIGSLPVGVDFIGTGEHHTCVLQADHPTCWGSSLFGELGDNARKQSNTPVSASQLTDPIAAIGGGHFFTCAVTTAGKAVCFGQNQNGQLGVESGDSASPVTVTGLDSGVAKIAVGIAHACVTLGSGGVRCWGNNQSGQLGDGTSGLKGLPRNATGLTAGVVEVTVGDAHSCALTGDKKILCWGANTHGQLGNDSVNAATEPVHVQGY